MKYFGCESITMPSVLRSLTLATFLVTSACAAVANNEGDAEKDLEKLGYTNVDVTDEDAVFSEEYCGDGYGTSFEFYGNRNGFREFGRLCIPEIGEVFLRPKVIPESRTPEDD